MTWFKLEDGFVDDDKVIDLSDGAFRLHVTAMCWCARNYETDGTFKKSAVSKRFGGKPKHVSELFESGLWEETGESFGVVNWLKHQRSAKQINAERDASRARKQKQRSGQGVVSRRDVGRSSTVEETETETETIPSLSGSAAKRDPKLSTGRVDHSNTKPVTPQRAKELGVVLPELTDEDVRSLPELRKRRGSAA